MVRKTLKRMWDGGIRLMLAYPGRVISWSLAFFIIVYTLPTLCTYLIPYSPAVLLPLVKSISELGGAASHFLNVVAIAGVIFSTLGFLYTYLQLRDSTDRIEGYRDFYYWIQKLFSEIEEGKATEFYFYGPTILPGNLAYGRAGKNDVQTFGNKLHNLFLRQADSHFDKVQRSMVIVPPVENYNDTYSLFFDLRMANFTGPEKWVDFVKEQKMEAQRCQT